MEVDGVVDVVIVVAVPSHLELLVRVVDEELLERVGLERLEAEDVEDRDEAPRGDVVEEVRWWRWWWW